MNAAPRSPRSPPSFRIRSKRPEPGAFRPVSRCECARNRPRNESRIASRERCGERLHESSIRKTSFADGNAGGLPKGVFRGTRTVARTVGGARLGGGNSAANPAGNTVLPACGRGSVVRTKGGVFADSSQAIFRASFDRRRFRVRPRPSVQARHGLPILSG